MYSKFEKLKFCRKMFADVFGVMILLYFAAVDFGTYDRYHSSFQIVWPICTTHCTFEEHTLINPVNSHLVYSSDICAGECICSWLNNDVLQHHEKWPAAGSLKSLDISLQLPSLCPAFLFLLVCLNVSRLIINMLWPLWCCLYCSYMTRIPQSWIHGCFSVVPRCSIFHKEDIL